MRSVADFIWVDLTGRLRRTPVLAAVLRDGSWLRGVPIVALVAPLVAIVIGYHFGADRSFEQHTYTYSLPLLMVLLASSMGGAALGVLVTAGYAIGDLFFFRHTTDAAIRHPDGLDHFGVVTVPLLISYLVLALLLVNVPFVAGTLRRVVTARTGAIAGAATFVAMAGALTLAWIRSVPFLIRPVFSFDNQELAPFGAFYEVQQRGNRVVFAALAFAVVRVALEWVWPKPLAPPALALTAPGPVGRTLRAVLTVVVGMMLVAGLASTTGDALLLFAAVSGSVLLRVVVLPSLHPYTRLLQRIPAFARALACVAAAYLAGRAVLTSAYADPNQAGFTPLARTIAITLVVTAVLMPQLRAPADKELTP